MDQIEHYAPPPNPAKLTDTRADGYIVRYGKDSWELDALEPAVITELIHDTVEQYQDEDLWNEMLTQEQEQKAQLQTVADQWEQIVLSLENAA